MSALKRLLASATLASAIALGLCNCGGTLLDADGARGAGASGSGLSCAQDNQCLCDPCQASAECASGLQCQDAKQHGTACGIKVCLAPGG